MKTSIISKATSVFEWIMVIFGVLSPLATFYIFNHITPPLFPKISFFTFGIAILVGAVIHSLKHVPHRRTRRLNRHVRSALICGFLWVPLLLLYILLLDHTTILDPQSHSQRFQIGFGKSDWSLTPIGLSLKQNNPEETLETWMLREGAFRQDGPTIIWTKWSISVAGMLCIVTYILVFALWTAGFTFLTKYNWKPKLPKIRPKTDIT